MLIQIKLDVVKSHFEFTNNNHLRYSIKLENLTNVYQDSKEKYKRKENCLSKRKLTSNFETRNINGYA